MKLNDDIRRGIMIGLVLVGNSPQGTAKLLFKVFEQHWPEHASAVGDLEIRDDIARECGVDLEQ